jgi:hypothetical protein
MISSASSPDRTPRAESATGYGPATRRPFTTRPDSVTIHRAAFLRAELVRQPEIRPEVLARGLALRDDPNYPPREVMASVASTILATPDLTDDES